MSDVVVGKNSKAINKKSKISAQDWRAYYLKWEQSSMSKMQFCREHGLKKDNFYYWCKRIRDENSSSLSKEFVPVVSRTVETPNSELITVEILFLNQMRLKMSVRESRLISLIREIGDAATIIR